MTINDLITILNQYPGNTKVNLIGWDIGEVSLESNMLQHVPEHNVIVIDVDGYLSNMELDVKHIQTMADKMSARAFPDSDK
tara:strand:- start:123 stop:365 length:243 start_codon:yes stop_codon:yes gene_type:complete